MVKIGRQKTRPNTLVSVASVRWRTLAEKVYYASFCALLNNIISNVITVTRQVLPVDKNAQSSLDESVLSKSVMTYD